MTSTTPNTSTDINTSITTGFDIRNLRQQLSMTQAEVAVFLGVTPVTVSCWERGVYTPPRAAYVALVLKGWQENRKRLTRESVARCTARKKARAAAGTPDTPKPTQKPTATLGDAAREVRARRKKKQGAKG